MEFYWGVVFQSEQTVGAEAMRWELAWLFPVQKSTADLWERGAYGNKYKDSPTSCHTPHLLSSSYMDLLCIPTCSKLPLTSGPLHMLSLMLKTLFSLIFIYRDPWVAQRFGACLWPRIASWAKGRRQTAVPPRDPDR